MLLCIAIIMLNYEYYVIKVNISRKWKNEFMIKVYSNKYESDCIHFHKKCFDVNLFLYSKQNQENQ